MKKNNFFYPVLLIALAILFHHQWFDFFSILNSSDWSYWPVDPTRQLFNSWGTWLNFWNLGYVNIQIPFFIFKFFWSLLVILGFSYDVAVKITFLIPIAVMGFLSPYILIKKIINKNFIAFLGAVYYGSVTYFLIRQTAHLPVAFVYAIAPLILYFFIIALEKNNFKNWLVFILIFFLGACYEIRIMYIVFFILIFYLLICQWGNFRKYILNTLLLGFILLLLNSFWIIPVFLGSGVNEIQGVANRGLFGSSLFSLGHALTVFDSSWTAGLANKDFVRQPIIIYFWVFPLIAFAAFLFKEYRSRKELIFFGVISLLGIFLTKQAAEPLSGAYSWLYNNFPGFNLFREASKFYLLTSIGYLGLLGYFFLALRDSNSKILNKFLFFILSFLILIFSFLNFKPLITGEIRTMFQAKTIPFDYIYLESFISSQKENFRVFWTPKDSRWAYYSNTNPKINNVNLISKNWQNYVDFVDYNTPASIQERIINIYSAKFANQLFNLSSIKYVIVPIQDIANDDDFFIHYGGRTDPNIRDWYIAELDKISWLNKIDIGTEELVIYENPGYRPHIYVTDEIETIYKETEYREVEHEFKNPTEYKVSLRNLSEPLYLNFSESYHPDWKIRVGDFNWFEVLYRKDYFLPDGYHFKNEAMLSSFHLDPEVICGRYDCVRNSDGSYNIDLTLYFRPQSYFYLGLIISGTTLLGCFGYLGYDFIRRRRRREEEGGVVEEENKD